MYRQLISFLVGVCIPPVHTIWAAAKRSQRLALQNRIFPEFDSFFRCPNRLFLGFMRSYISEGSTLNGDTVIIVQHNDPLDSMHNKVVEPKHFPNGRKSSKDLPNMNAFCDWLSETIVISVYDSFFRNYISMDLLSFIVLNSQSKRLFI